MAITLVLEIVSISLISLSGVGIPLVGRATARTIARAYLDFHALQLASVEELASLADFGQITAETLYKAMHSTQGVDLFARLENVGVILESVQAVSSDPFFTGKVFVITGTLENCDRKQLIEELEKRGAKVSGSISKNTSVLIAGEKAGSKLKKATSLGVEVWDEQQLAASLSE